MRAEGNSTAMSTLPVPITYSCRTTTCGMMILLSRNNRKRCRINSLNMFLPHRHHQPKLLLRLRLSVVVNQAIQQDISTNKKPLNQLLINHLHHHQRFHRQEKRHHPRRTTIICSRPPRKSLPVNTNTRKRQRHQRQLPVPPRQPYQ